MFFGKSTFSVVVLREIFPMGYHARQKEIIRPIRNPRNFAIQLTPKRGPQFDVSSSRVRFWDLEKYMILIWDPLVNIIVKLCPIVLYLEALSCC